MKTVDVCFYVGEKYNINKLPAVKDTISVQRQKFSTGDDEFIESITKEAIKCLAERYNQDYEEIVYSEKYLFTISTESFCEAPDGSRISCYVAADFFYEGVQAEINRNELLADICRESTEPKCRTINTKKEKKNFSAGDALYSSVGFATWLLRLFVVGTAKKFPSTPISEATVVVKEATAKSTSLGK
jgi:hypothetical protein